MKRLMIAAVALLVLLNLSLAYAQQHGKGMGAGGTSVGHKPMDAGHSATSHTPQGGKMSPSEMLAGKPNLSTRLAKLIPGTDIATACDGFRNLGQCVAAIHVSSNLKLSFTDLKTNMLGKAATSTAPAVPPMSLGKAIQAIDPKADAQAEVNKANKQAKQDMKTTG